MSETSPAPRAGPACDDARLAASLALDGALDEVGRAHLRRHLGSCPECDVLVGEMEGVSALLREAPRARFRCELPAGRLVRSCSSGHVRHWAGAAAAVAALVLTTGALPHRDDAARPPSRAAVVTPLALPIGQRSAMDDFAPASAGLPTRSS